MSDFLRITAEMAEPIVYYGDGLHLDGILAYGAFLALSRAEREALPPISSAWAEDLDLPLERWEVASPICDHNDSRLYARPGIVWGWRASAAHVRWLAQDSRAVRKMPALDEMKRRTRDKTAQISMGQLKACNILHPSRFAHRVQWFAAGDASAVERLLSLVRSIGKLANHGAGRVAAWSVEIVDRDHSVERDGALTRKMPIGYSTHGSPSMETIRPPYHHRSREIMCWVPDYEDLLPEDDR